jgi:pimeloyl-ACP methyl ester carboxylesterase
MNKALREAGIKEKFFHTGDMLMNYVAGPDNGMPLVFIPGQTMTWEEYALLMPKLVDRFQVFAVSLRGHGKSSWTPGKYTFNQLGQDMTAFLKEVVGRPAIVIGNSSGGVLTAWLAANAPDYVKAIVLEDPPLFRCDWPNIKDTWVYDMFLGLSKMAVQGSGGYARFFENSMKTAQNAGGVVKRVPKPLIKLIIFRMALHQIFAPGKPLDIKFLPPGPRTSIKSISQYDGHFSRAFVNGTAGEGFYHAETLARITQPVLFLHANWFMREGRLMGALDDEDVQRVQSLVKGLWKYVRVDNAHAIALDIPDKEAEIILNWIREGVG